MAVYFQSGPDPISDKIDNSVATRSQVNMRKMEIGKMNEKLICLARMFLIDIFAYRFNVSLRQIPVQLSQMEKRERHANDVDNYPESVEYIVAERAVHQRTAGRVVAAFRVRCQGPAEKRGSQIDRYTGEPDHEGAEQHALRTTES